MTRFHRVPNTLAQMQGEGAQFPPPHGSFSVKEFAAIFLKIPHKPLHIPVHASPPHQTS